MRYRISGLAAVIGIVVLVCITPAAFSNSPKSRSQGWAVAGGEFGLIWNRELLRDLGVSLSVDPGLIAADSQGFVPFSVDQNESLEFAVANRGIAQWLGGGLRLADGDSLQWRDRTLSLGGARLRARPGNSLSLNLVSSDGTAWFFLDRLMTEFSSDGSILRIRSMDLRIAPALARELGRPAVAGWTVAHVRMRLRVVSSGPERVGSAPGAPNWPGNPAPNGGTYQADVFMVNLNTQYMRCSLPDAAVGECDGPAPEIDGEVVFAPTSTLSNNVNEGSLLPTVLGDPLGTSAAPYTADIAWFPKFSGSNPPYDVDQHPYLIWNLYRMDAQGGIEQIGRSGLKHAFFTINLGDNCDNSNGGNVLGVRCSDVYGTASNDDSESLGPRREIVPATGVWARCGSIYDVNCDGLPAPSGNGPYSHRMIVRESQIAANTNSGATYWFEAWYVVRDDINIYNTMAVRPVGFYFMNGGPWMVNDLNPLRLGPAINQWVNPNSVTAGERNLELASIEGHTRIAVKVAELGAGQWRYDYAVMNFDFARATTSGTPGYSDDSIPAQRFRIVHNYGYDRFEVSVPDWVTVGSTRFSDGDSDALNDWIFDRASDLLSWSARPDPLAPAGVPPVLNSLNWGTLYFFSFVADAAPGDAKVELHVAQSGVPQTQSLILPAPKIDSIFADRFEMVP